MISRRKFSTNALLAIAGVAFGVPALASRRKISMLARNVVKDETLNATIPQGASLRIVARSSETVGHSTYRWHAAPDGGACFPAPDGGWIYVSNSELGSEKGGAGALRFSTQGELADAYPVLRGTSRNCAGGKTPWGTWVSCEENGEVGQAWECDPMGRRKAEVRPAMGSFNHEAIAVDPQSSRVYLTEDKPDGCLYRFTPEQYGDLSNGLLEVAVKGGQGIEWQEIPDPGAKSRPLRHQIERAARFKGGEGIVYHQGYVYFTTKHDNRVWSLQLDTGKLDTVYDASAHKSPILTGVDNIEVTSDGELLVAEDGGDMQIIVLNQAGEATPLVTLYGQDGSEITGPAFSPDASRLYFSSQRGVRGRSDAGLTYELRLPA